MNIPDDFPRFAVPGFEREMRTMRSLYWLHYPGSGPKSTLWDEWLTDASLWPAVATDDHSNRIRQGWRAVLTSRIMDGEGYVATHQHHSIAHQLGWPFPFVTQGDSGCCWFFSFKDMVGEGWRPKELCHGEGWTLDGAESAGIEEYGWRVRLTGPDATMTPPAWEFDTFQAPFLQLRWMASGLGDARPYVEWTTPENPEFSADRRMFFDLGDSQLPSGEMYLPKRDAKLSGVDSDRVVYTMVPAHRHPEWKGAISQLRIGLGNRRGEGEIVVQAFFTQYDTRHNINNPNFARGCANYFWWTGDVEFLRREINRARTAMRYMMTEHGALAKKVVVTTWIGHDGRSGLNREGDKKKIFCGRGIGNNYWDLLPFGNADAYATIQYYDALQSLARLEEEIIRHPEWNVPRGVHAFDPAFLRSHAAEVKAEGNRLFWNGETGRFAAAVDAEGKKPDFGFTFLNLEAIYYDFATAEHAKQIMDWMSGARTVAGDTATGDEIYHWRFAPRATTRRNEEYYFWAWSNPEGIPWGGQIQDGGAVLGFSYHDLMARIGTLGPDDAWARLREILKWFEDAQAAGSYRKYYDGSREGSLQGGGTAGGLGLDCEFFESALVPQVMLYGFMGVEPTGDGIRVNPRLPREWPELRIDRIRRADVAFSLTASDGRIEIKRANDEKEIAKCDGRFVVELPEGAWTFAVVNAQGLAGPESKVAGGRAAIDWTETDCMRFTRTK
ncbi:MAG TPA: hypothetical protein PL033_04505 [Candidatus Brocadiia bacterium]|nr:hypothetical protein [Candidatus Brocadiia bacterium]